MKKLFLFAVSALMILGSCSQDEMMNAPLMSEDGQTTIVASFEGQAGTRMTESKGVMSWEASDNFVVFGTPSNVTFTTTAEKAQSGIFTGTGTPADNSYAAYYPITDALSLSGNTLTVTLASAYDASTSIKAPMWGTYNGGSISFKHLGAALKFTYENIPEGYTTLEVEASEPINGAFTATLTESEPVLATNAKVTDENKKVTVTIPSDANSNSNGVFYIPLPVGTYDLKVTAKSTSADLVLKSWTNQTFVRKGLYITTATYVSTAATTPSAVSDAISSGLSNGAVVDITGEVDATADNAGSMVLPKVDASYNFAATPTTSSTAPLKFEEASGSDGANVNITNVNINMPADATGIYAVINTPNSTVSIEGGTYERLYATTAENTLIIGAGVTIKKLVVKGGNVVLKGNVESIESEVATTTTITLVDDITLAAPITLSKGNVTFDLGGKTLTAPTGAFVVANGTLTVKNGTIDANKKGYDAIGIKGASESSVIVVNVESDAILKGGDCCVVVYESNKSKDITINTKGTLVTESAYESQEYPGYAAISANANSEGVKMNVTGGSITAKVAAIYFPCKTSLTISDGTITGATAVYQKSGELTISGGKLVGNGEKKEYIFNNNGCNETGDALVVESCNYPKGAPTISITGGEFVSTHASAIGSYVGNNVAEEDKITGFVQGGIFHDASVFEYLAANASITLGADIITAPNTVIPAGVTIDGADHSVNTTIASNDVATGKGKGVFKLNGGTIKNITFDSANTQYDIIVTAGGSTIQGCSFPTATNTNMNAGKRAIFTGADAVTGNLAVTGCTFDDKVYAFNFSNATNTMDITFTNCTLGGWLSGHGGSHTFNNCTFKKSGDYQNYIPYCPATFNGCIFEKDFAISLKKGSTYEFDTACTYDGETISEPEDLKWDYSGGTAGTGDNGADEYVKIGDAAWYNSVPEGSEEEEATPKWLVHDEYIPV